MKLHWLFWRWEVLCDYTVCNWPGKYHCRRPTKFPERLHLLSRKSLLDKIGMCRDFKTPFCSLHRSRGCINHFERAQFVNLSPNWVPWGLKMNYRRICEAKIHFPSVTGKESIWDKLIWSCSITRLGTWPLGLGWEKCSGYFLFRSRNFSSIASYLSFCTSL